MRVLLRIILPAVFVAACPGGEPAAGAPEAAPAEIVDAVWLQERWWIAHPGETVESLDWWDEGGERFPLVQLRASSGARRAVVLEAVGAAREVDAVSAPRTQESSVASSADERWRVRVTTEARLQVELVDMQTGERARLLDEVAAGRRFRHPAVEQGTVFVEWVGSGLVRLDAQGGPPVRIVPEAEARQPLALPGEVLAVMYVEQRAGEAPELRVARPLPEIDARAAASLRERLPAELVDAVRGWDGRWRRAVPCDDPGPLRVDASGDLWRFSGPVSFEADAVASCGPGCWSLLGHRGGGGRVLRARFSRADGGWWLTPSGAPRQGFVDVGSVALTVDACGARRDPGHWMQQPVHLADKGDAIVGIEPGQGGRLRAHASAKTRRRPQPYRVVFEPSGVVSYVQRTANPVVFPKGAAAARVAGASANVVDGVLRWQRRDEVHEVMGPSDARQPGHVSLSADGTELLWDEDGESPGIWLADWRGEPVRVSPDPTARAPVTLGLRSERGAAWIDTFEQRDLLVIGRPLRDDEASAWDAGPATLLDLPLVWLPDAPEGAACAQPALRVEVDDAGVPALVGKRAVALRAGVVSDGAVHYLGPTPAGAPRLSLSLIPRPGGGFEVRDPLGLVAADALWPDGAEDAPARCAPDPVWN